MDGVRPQWPTILHGKPIRVLAKERTSILCLKLLIRVFAVQRLIEAGFFTGHINLHRRE